MTTTNTSDLNVVGSATMQNGEFLTFDGLIANRFSLIIPSAPNVSFFLQKFTLPTVSVRQVLVSSPVVDYNDIGEKLDFEPFTVTFLVDKYLRNWSNIYNWMKAMTVNGSNVGKTDDIVLMVDGKEFIRFYGAWPTSVSGFDFDSTIEDLVYTKASVTFNYDYFDLIGMNSTTDSQYT